MDRTINSDFSKGPKMGEVIFSPKGINSFILKKHSFYPTVGFDPALQEIFHF